MALFTLVPGAGGMAWYWHRVTPLLRESGHQAIAAREQAALSRGYAVAFDPETYFLHDVPTDVRRTGPEAPRREAEIVFGEPCRFEHWPAIPIHVLAGRDDRFFPVEFQQRVARERLGKDVEEIAGGHLVALSNPEGLTRRLLAYERNGLSSVS
ncbi:MAG TPA: hypothetical protein VKY65_14695 [Alphaproteobacteria bacterium]|nr:hypothetical protein [Alphaproteobacteria bacterium]